MAETLDPVFDLSSSFVDDYAKLSPVSASMAGVPGVHDRWDDYSPAGGAKVLALVNDYLKRLDALPPATDARGKLARRVMADFLDEKVVYYRYEDNLADLNNIESPMQHLRVVFDVMDTSTVEGWGAVAKRLETIDGVMASYRAALEAGAAKGITAAKRQVRAALTQAKNHASDKSSFKSLLASFDAANIDDPALRERLVAAVAHTQKSYAAFAPVLEQYLAKATDDDAFGRERYLRSAKRFLGLDIDPLETYAWGFREIRAIEAAMAEVAGRIMPGKTVAEVIAALQTSPEQLVDNTTAFIKLMQERQERALNELMGTHFDVPAPIRRIDIKLAPTGGALGAYYIPPNEDFSRPGTVFYAPAEGQKFTIFSEITTAYHEGFPGHHLQCGLQVHMSGELSRLHRLFVVCSGYAEGWALYAEQLMEELGYYDKPEFVLGMHMAKLFRACRVAADIGMHLGLTIPSDFDFHPGEKWTWEHCVEILNKRAFINRDMAESEATRYLGWPGQAISYKVGERVILDLRREMRERLGAKFDLRAFHEVVLNSGSVGLEHLRDIVRERLLPAA
jgi:uncharacterized protein (DUF885 family)